MPAGIVKLTFEQEFIMQLTTTSTNGFMGAIIGDRPQQGLYIAQGAALGSRQVDDKYLAYSNVFDFIKCYAVAMKWHPNISENVASATTIEFDDLEYAYDGINNYIQLEGSYNTSPGSYRGWLSDKEHNRVLDPKKYFCVYRKVMPRMLKNDSDSVIQSYGRNYYDVAETPATGWHNFVFSTNVTGLDIRFGRMVVRWYCTMRGSGITTAPP